MQVIQLGNEMRSCVDAWRQQGLRIGFVPTMGNLHAGHLSLIDVAKQHCDKVVVSVFVNPMQFNEQADFDRYLRPMENDLTRLEQAEIATMFAPLADEIYPDGLSQITRVEVPVLSETLEGEHRPGHFCGVTTVVNILFNIVQPNVAVFGEKDYQQLLLIKTMLQDLQLPIQILSAATCREADGLAMSSRNQHLNADERKLAPVLFQTLQQLKDEVLAGNLPVSEIEQKGMQLLQDTGFQPDYVAVRDANNLTKIVDNTENTGPRIILLAAQLGATRLIDNLQVDSA